METTWGDEEIRQGEISSATMVVEAEEFMRDPAESWRTADSLRKEDWWRLVRHIGLQLPTTATKQTLRDGVRSHLVEQGWFEDEEEEGREEAQVDGISVGGERLAILKLELEFKREQAALEAEERRAQREHEIELARMRGATQEAQVGGDALFYKARSAVPKFNEKDPEDFFAAFEQMAETLCWQPERWALLAQSAFPAKAQGAYLGLSTETRGNYSRVKEEVLKAYEVTAEHYRSKFRETKKQPGKSFSEYAHDLERNLDRWWRTLGADSMEKVREAVLLEQFLQGVATEVKIYLGERRVATVEEAASLAEDYVIFTKQGKESRGAERQTGRFKQREYDREAAKTVHCLRCKRPNHLAWQCRTYLGGNSAQNGAVARNKCFLCAQVGHVAAACPRRQGVKKQSGSSACVGQVGQRAWRLVERGGEEDGEARGYEEYVRRGHVLLGGNRIPVRILRDSGTRVNLVREGVVPRVQRNGEIVVKGVAGMTNAGKVKVTIQADQKRREVELAVVRELPIAGVDILLGNENGGKLVMTSLFADGPGDEGGETAEEDKGTDREGGHGRGETGSEERGRVSGPARREECGAEGVTVKTVGTGARKEERKKGGGMTEPRGGAAKRGVSQQDREENHREERRRYLEDLGRFLTTPEVQIEGEDRRKCLGENQQEGQSGGAEGGHESLEGVAVVTRAAARLQTREAESMGDVGAAPRSERCEARGEGFTVKVAPRQGEEYGLPLSKSELVNAQREDKNLAPIWQKAESEADASGGGSHYLVEKGILKRRWTPQGAKCGGHQSVTQVVIPKSFVKGVIKLAHEETTAHLGSVKTAEALQTHMFWHGLKKDVSEFIKKCHVCQVSDKKGPVKAPLQPIPIVGEPFQKIVVDVVGPLPKTKGGNEYLLTLMCTATRYSEAIPMSSCKARKIVPKLVEIFSRFGMPKIIQSDQGSNFTSKFFQKALSRMNVTHVTSTAFHPQSQGCLERFHATLKGILTKFCLHNGRDWDEGVQVALYAIRTAKNESLGYSPFELMFGRKPRENLRLVAEAWEAEEGEATLPVTDYVKKLGERMECAHKLARENMARAQTRMKCNYDKKSRVREFKEGDQVLYYDSSVHRPLQARYRGPYTVLEKLGPVTYLISTPDRRKERRRVHLNLIKEYKEEAEASAAIGVDGEELPEEALGKTGSFSHENQAGPRLENSQALQKLHARLDHLGAGQTTQLLQLLQDYKGLLNDTPTRTDILQHDLQLTEGARPVRKQPYRLSPEKRKLMAAEVEYLLENGMAEPSNSTWASPCLLVRKDDGTHRLCTDYRKLNAVTLEDPYPMQRIDELIDEAGAAKFLTTLDLLKGFWQVGLTKQAREASAFVTPDGHYHYTVMPFGMKNSSATFQRLADRVVSGLPGVTAYVDDILVYSNTWEEHVERLKALFTRLLEASLTLNLDKCVFGAPTVKYLGHDVGAGGIRPLEAKVADIKAFPAPRNKKGLRRFLGMIGFYRRFCKNFAQVASPLTDLLSERRTWQWSPACQEAFEDLKALLASTPILQAPNFEKAFMIYTDASDQGIGSMLGQESEGIVKPVAYMSKKLLRHQKDYSVVEKEALALVKALEKFAPYLGKKITVWSDHNPLAFLETMKVKNARLARWALAIQDKNIEIKHVPGKENVVADALSRPA